MPRAPDDLDDPRRILRGRFVYVEMQCGQCHGIDGQGTGATRTEYVDAWGNPQKPFNFTRGSLKGGNSAEDIYRTFHTGLRSIMPSYGGDTAALATVETYGSQEWPRCPRRTSNSWPPSSRILPRDLGRAVRRHETRPERLELARRNSWDLVAYILSLRQSHDDGAGRPRPASHRSRSLRSMSDASRPPQRSTSEPGPSARRRTPGQMAHDRGDVLAFGLALFAGLSLLAAAAAGTGRCRRSRCSLPAASG